MINAKKFVLTFAYWTFSRKSFSFVLLNLSCELRLQFVQSVISFTRTAREREGGRESDRHACVRLCSCAASAYWDRSSLLPYGHQLLLLLPVLCSAAASAPLLQQRGV